MPPLLRNFLLVSLVARTCLCSFVPPNLGGSSESGGALTEVTQRKSGAEYVALDKGRAQKESSQGYDKGESASHGQKQDTGRYDDKEESHKGYDVGRQSLGQSYGYDKGDNAFEKHGSGHNKKGYHKSGFSNNYHKDESGNKESFYEDSDDERGHRGYENRDGQYGQKHEDAFRDGRHSGAFSGRNRGQQGLYDNGAGYNNRRGHTGAYDNNHYYDDRRNFLQDGSGKFVDRNGNEVYYRREQPAYRHYGPAPLVSGPLYSRDYLDAPPPRYYYHREEPHFAGDLYRPAYRLRYIPERRDYHRGDIYYPENRVYRGGYGGGYVHGSFRRRY